jgi:hypothetical protein
VCPAFGRALVRGRELGIDRSSSIVRSSMFVIDRSSSIVRHRSFVRVPDIVSGIRPDTGQRVSDAPTISRS